MPLYTAAAATPAAITAAPIATLWAASGLLRVKEIGITCNAATASAITIYRATNTPVASTTLAGLPYNPSDSTGTGLLGTAWSTPPTISSLARMRSVQLPAAIGAGIIWQFNDLIVGVAGVTSLVLWNHSGVTNSILQLYVVWEE